MHKFFKRLLPLADAVLAPTLYPAAFLMKLIRIAGTHRMPLCRQVLLQVGAFPIRNHYFEPLFDARALRRPLEQERHLPGIKWDDAAQLQLLAAFSFADELKDLPFAKTDDLSYYLDNRSFKAGDAEFLYSLLRLKKPARVVEIGSGNSTKIAMQAIRKNKEEDAGYRCSHICIEPYEQPWLEKSGVTVLREKVEDVDAAVFSQLEEDDLLFIDSSHVIRPQGDVLFEYLELLPSLKPGVIVHVHDIFSPRDYPVEWVRDEVRLWNEQYLLEAFLTGNPEWKIVGAVNFLRHKHFDRLKAACPHLCEDSEPGSFYLQKQ